MTWDTWAALGKAAVPRPSGNSFAFLDSPPVTQLCPTKFLARHSCLISLLLFVTVGSIRSVCCILHMVMINSNVGWAKKK